MIHLVIIIMKEADKLVAVACGRAIWLQMNVSDHQTGLGTTATQGNEAAFLNHRETTEGGAEIKGVFVLCVLFKIQIYCAL